MAKGVRSLLEFVPGGRYFHDLGADILERWRRKKAQKELEEEVKEIVGAKADAVIAAAAQAVEESAPGLTSREQELLTQFVADIPAAARRTFSRKEDPRGNTIPPGLTFLTPDDVASVLPPPPRFVPGDWVPDREENWRLVRKLGSGGFGEVWLTRHEWQRWERAIKFCTDPSAREKLITHEKKVIVRVAQHAGEHPNIVSLLECNLKGDAPWLMYEYVAGGTLAGCIPDWQALPPAERLPRVISTFRALVSAVSHFHALNPPIIHRDLKPANVLMAGDTPRVTDFGIGAVSADHRASEETRRSRSGHGSVPAWVLQARTDLYASPQQQAHAAPDPRDDVHALGVIGYQMFTGDLYRRVGVEFEEDLLEAGASGEFVALLRRCVSPRSERRPRDARELFELLPGEPRSVRAPLPDATPARPPEAAKATESVVKFSEAMPDPSIGQGVASPTIPRQVKKVRGNARRDNPERDRLRDAAEKGDAAAQFHIGEMMASGSGVRKNYVAAAEWYRKAAEQGHAGAQRNLARMYAKGQGVLKDESEAVNWYRRAAEQEDAEAQGELGEILVTGGPLCDLAVGYEWLRKAAEQGHPQSQFYYGFRLAFGLSGQRDEATGYEWFRKGAEQGHCEAQLFLAIRCEGRYRLGKDQLAASEWYRKAAEQGNAEAQYHLGRMYAEGRGVSQDYISAAEWYRKAAQQGDRRAQTEYGLLWMWGNGVTRNDQIAVEWFRKAAKQRDAKAQYLLGSLYEDGDGVEQNHRIATEWYSKAAESFRRAADTGDTEAQAYLAFLYTQGKGVPKDHAVAVEWYRKAADGGDPAAQCELACAYEAGRGVTRDYAAAITWYRKAAEQGYTGAFYALGYRYEIGQGVQKDLQEALAWYLRAVNAGSTDAKEDVARVERLLRT